MRAAARFFLCLLLVLTSVNAYGQGYRVLVTNDDGIESPLLAILAEEIASLDNVEVTVVAPHENQSGSSHSLTGSPLIVDRIERDGELFGYAVHGRPADSVSFGLGFIGSDDPFDLVVSGINRGANVGNVSHASGTVGAAMRAQYLGVPSIAASQAPEDVDTRASARFIARLVDRYRREGPPEGILLSVNFPSGESQGVRIRPMGESYLAGTPYTAVSRDGDSVTYDWGRRIVRAEDPASDTYSYQRGYITVTPLRFDWTAHDFIDELESWNLQ